MTSDTFGQTARERLLGGTAPAGQAVPINPQLTKQIGQLAADLAGAVEGGNADALRGALAQLANLAGTPLDRADQPAKRGRRPTTPRNFPPLTVTIAETKRITGLGNTTIYERLNDGTLRSTLVGGRRLVHYDSILEMLGVADKDAA